MKKQITISELCSYLHRSYYADVAVENDTGMHPSPERVRQIAIAKLKQPQNQKIEATGETVISATNPASEKKERKVMKKSKIRILTIAAVICLMSITVFAMTSGLDYFKSIFGDSAAMVRDDIQSPLLSNVSDDYRITVESLLSDGYKTNMVVSLESLKGSQINDEASGLFSVGLKDKSGAAKGISYSCEALEEFRQGYKYFYRIEASSLNSHRDSSIEVALRKQGAALKIDIPVEHSTAAKEFKIDAKNYKNKNYRPETLQLSPLGVLVIGSEEQAKGGLPTAEIILLVKDGTTEELMSDLSFDSNESGDDTVVTGGGGVVIVEDGQQAPLVTRTMGERNPDGKVVTTGYFSRILDLNQVKAIIVDGTEYPMS